MNNTLKKVFRIVAYGIIGMLFFISLELAMWFIPPGRGLFFWQWNSSGSILVNEEHSIELLSRGIHPYLAEYEYRLNIYNEDGRKENTIDLHINSGGQTYMKLYISDDNQILLVDHMGNHLINLENLDKALLYEAPKPPNCIYLGAFANNFNSLIFIPSNVTAEG